MKKYRAAAPARQTVVDQSLCAEQQWRSATICATSRRRARRCANKAIDWRAGRFRRSYGDAAPDDRPYDFFVAVAEHRQDKCNGRRALVNATAGRVRRASALSASGGRRCSTRLTLAPPLTVGAEAIERGGRSGGATDERAIVSLTR